MRNFKLTVAYDGTRYFGWQAQPDRVTVQETLEAAVSQITGHRVRLHASGRTDTGVHALGQVVGLRIDTHLSPQALRKALNAVLPDDLVVLEALEADDDFHPRYSAKRKRYRYVIYNGEVRNIFARQYAWHFKRGRLDVDAMQRAAQPLVGKHDFSTFESSGAKRKTSIRTVFSLDIRRAGESESEPGRPRPRQQGSQNLALFFPNPTAHPEDWILLDIEADGFLYNMVRTITGTLVEVGRGARPESWPFEILEAADRRRAGPTAPPQGLFLVNVDYEPDPIP